MGANLALEASSEAMVLNRFVLISNEVALAWIPGVFCVHVRHPLILGDVSHRGNHLLGLLNSPDNLLLDVGW